MSPSFPRDRYSAEKLALSAPNPRRDLGTESRDSDGFHDQLASRRGQLTRDGYFLVGGIGITDAACEERESGGISYWAAGF